MLKFVEEIICEERIDLDLLGEMIIKDNFKVDIKSFELGSVSVIKYVNEIKGNPEEKSCINEEEKVGTIFKRFFVYDILDKVFYKKIKPLENAQLGGKNEIIADGVLNSTALQNYNSTVVIEKDLYTPSIKALLQVVKLPDTYVNIDAKEFFIGRTSEECNLTIENKTVGRIHSKIIFQDHNYYIVDLNSKNGTYLNGEKISPNINIKLENYDKLQFSDETFVFTAEQNFQDGEIAEQ